MSNAANDQLNPFDLARLRLSQNYAAMSSVKKLLTTVPVRKPDRQAFVRVHPEWRLQTCVIEVKEDGETFLVDQDLWGELSAEITPKVLFTAITRQEVVFIWPVRLPGPDGRLDAWNSSALTAAQEAESNWVRVTSNRSLGAYEIFRAEADVPDPNWPDISFQGLLEIAFRDRFIRDLDHPVVRKLRGKV